MVHHILLPLVEVQEEHLEMVVEVEVKEEHTLFLLNYLLIQDLTLVPNLLELVEQQVELIMVLNLLVVWVMYLVVKDLVVMVDSVNLLILIVGLIHGLLQEIFHYCKQEIGLK